MSFAFVQQAKFRRTLLGRVKLAAWDFWTAFLAWYDIDAGEMPKSWRKGT
jgi:hypothetical protein